MSSRDGVGAGTRSSLARALNREKRGGRFDLGGPELLFMPPPGRMPHEFMPPPGAKTGRPPLVSAAAGGFFWALNREDLLD